MNSTSLFYRFLKEDAVAFEFQEAGRINADGIVNSLSLGQEDIEEQCLEICPEIRKRIQFIYNQVINLEGRCNKVYLDIDISLKEVGDVTRQAVQIAFNKSIRILFQGSGLWKVLSPLVERVFEKWCNKDPNFIITPLFHQILKSDPNDYDFEFVPDIGFGLVKQIVDQGLVELLATKFKAKRIRPGLLALELAKYKQKIEKKSSQSYIRRVFLEHPNINASQPGLHHLFIKAFAFHQAADVSKKRTKVCFSERK